jgi:DNA-binding response OmpR family regulator
MENRRILVIDDDPDLLTMLERILSSAGAQVISAIDGPEGLRQFFDHRPDLILLDLMMPGMDGWEVCQRIRQYSDVPIIMLTALSQDGEMVRGLDIGADDFVVKPFNIGVLLARARVTLRRGEGSRNGDELARYDDGYLTISWAQRQVRVRGEAVKLSSKEFQLLAYLARNPGRVLTFRQILDHVWRERGEGRSEYVHAYISRLRRKLGMDAESPGYFVNEHGVGYRFEAPRFTNGVTEGGC